ncbi:MAG: hypothetical protein GC159_09335 [Phycisphaera sp.]|nr:hypothetical protein [Phycisphaera sp.]
MSNRRSISTPHAASWSTAVAVMLACSAVALAVHPGEWNHRTEADFEPAETENTVVTSYGEITLARATEALGTLEGDDSIVYDIARAADGKVFLAVGPEGKLMKIDGDKVAPVDEFPGSQVFALTSTAKGLWVAVSGAPSRLELRSGADMKPTRTIELKDVRYVWDMVVVGDTMWLATGLEGQVLALDLNKKDAEPKVMLDTKQDNILCLGSDQQGRIYAGTDGEGLVYRITPKGDTAESFVLYDAGEPEIGALLVLNDGTVYAGTADARQARPGRLEKASTEPKGKIEKPAGGIKEPSIPNVPPKAEPNAPGKAAANGKPAKGDANDKPADAPEVAKADTPKPGDQPAPKPTAEQYDQLRSEIGKRLEQARQSGAIKLQASQTTTSRAVTSRSSGPALRRPGAAPSKSGNAIYRINTDGFVREIFRESVMILRIVQIDGSLLVGTGNEGQVYRVDPDTEEVSILADLEPQQIPAMIDVGAGEVLLGTANPGKVLRLKDDYAKQGTLSSATLDAKQISLWGKVQVSGATAGKSTIQIQTRSGNVADPEAGSWSKWSDPQTVALTGGQSAYLDVYSPTARFLQYRVVLNSDGKNTPRVLGVALKYLMPNLRPKVEEIKTDHLKPKPSRDSDAPQPQTIVKVEWKAADANGDALVYTLEARPFAEPNTPFVPVATDLGANTYEWDTRTMADGRYVLRVTASDEPDNIADQTLTATRISDAVIVDNTPPDIHDLKVTVANGVATLTARLTDALSPITEARYRVGGDEEWKIVLPADLIYDSTNENLAVKIPGLAQGDHVVALRVTDALGNTRYASKNVTVK